MTDFIEQSPTDTNFVQNPYAFYENWRAKNFLYWQEYKFAVSARYEVVNNLLRDRRFGRQLPSDLIPQIAKHLEPFFDFESRSLLELEPPEHTRIRAQVLRAFTSRKIKSIEPDLIKLTHELIEDFPNDEFDLIKFYAEKIPVIIIANLIGVEESDCDQLLKWSHAMVAMYQANRDTEIEQKATKAVQEFTSYIDLKLSEKRQSPKDDLLSHLASLEGAKLSTQEIITTVILLLNAGHEATVHAIGNGVKTLLEENIDPLGFDMSSIVEETLRFDAPLHLFTRYAQQDVEIFGHQFKRGETVGLMLGAANRDPAHYINPEQFDPNRNASDHTSLGAGIHFCLGAQLARLELKHAFASLFELCPKITIVRKPLYANRYHFHGLEALWVKI